MNRLICVTLLFFPLGAITLASDQHVSEELITKRTVAIIDVDVANLDMDLLAKSYAELAGAAPDKAGLAKVNEFRDKLIGAGAAHVIMVYNVEKKKKLASATDDSLIAIEKSENADDDKIAAVIYETFPEFKNNMSDGCPKTVGNNLVWYKKNSKIAKSDETRATHFAYAYLQVPDKQAVTVVLMPNDELGEAEMAELKGDEKELVNTLFNSSGICIFTDFGISAKPAVKTLVLAADADDAAKFQSTIEKLVADFKKELPGSFTPLLDSIKAVQAGTIVQIGLSMADGAKIINAFAATANAGENPTANENAARAACKDYVVAQEIYHRTDYQKAELLQYAQHMKGDNSLLETKTGAGDLGLIDKTLADAEGNPGAATPKAGYCFKILTKQGASATGGTKDYLTDGHMTAGYALLAYPANYGQSGVNCFIINNMGITYSKDLGAQTAAEAAKMTEFNPDKSWTAE